MLKGYASVLFATCVLAGLCVCASAQAAGQGLEVVGSFAPTNLTPGGQGTLDLYVYNTGAVAGEAPVVVTDTLPAGVSATGGAGCTGTTLVTCEAEGLVTGGRPTQISIPVSVAANVAPGSEAVDRVIVNGGGASNAASATVPVRFGPAAPGLGFSLFDGWFSNANGTVDTQAGSHPYELTLALGFDNDGAGPSGGEPRGLDLDLPPGLISDARAVPQCARALFDAQGGQPSEAGGCPPATVIGEDTLVIAGHKPVTVAVYNLQPPPGVMAELGFSAYSTHVVVDMSIRGSQGYGLVARFTKMPQLHVLFDSLTLWGVPAEEANNPGRGGNPADTPPAALLTLPSSCGSSLAFSAEIAGTWEDPSASATGSFLAHDGRQAPIELAACDHLGFPPALTAAPDTAQGDTPAGVTVELTTPEEELSSPLNLAISNMQTTTVTLPQGLAVNPGFANALVACQPSEDGLGAEGPPTCPASSKIGEAEIETPLIKGKLTGNVYILQSQPPDIKLVAAASGDGANLKLQGTLELNGATGQPTLTLAETPQLPLATLRVVFDGGAQAVLATPPICGQYTTDADFTPSSSPAGQDVLLSKSFAIESGPGGTPCTAQLPFDPTMAAGSSTDQAGGYVSFSMLLERGDGQQRISAVQFKMPPGLQGMIAKVPLCAEPQAAAGTCPQASQVGHVVLGAGPGPYPLFIPQAGGAAAAIYLTGPYQGAPYGLSIGLPLVAGPFNLGTEVLRAKIEVDPHTGQWTIVTGSLPRIAGGIPLDLRALDLTLDRPGFMFNPTDCNPTSVTGAVSSFEGATVPVESHFQVGSCQVLKFEPHLTIATQAKTSKAAGASLTLKLTSPTGVPSASEAEAEANLQTLALKLPKQLTPRPTTVKQACAASVFAVDPANCPAASVVGSATATTPILPVPLTGPAYYVSHVGQALPSLTIVLQSSGVTLDLVASVVTSKAKVSTVTFTEVPDIPVSALEVTLAEGPHSAFAASADLCKGALAAPSELVGQNGATVKQSTKLTVSGCHKAKAAKKSRKAKGGKTHRATARKPRKHRRGGQA
jgi:uncharacterized repeat protein (TIGR01451 family)